MTFQILALSGGGYLGLFTAYVLAELEREAGRPIAQSFDLLAGTSIGGILALGLSKEVPAAQLRDLFAERGEKIFSGRPPQSRTDLGALWEMRRWALKPRYDGVELRRAVSDVLGAETLLGEALHRVIVPTVNMTKGSVQMLKTGHHESIKRDPRRKMVEIAMATSAAPTFFPLAEMDGAMYVDGGIVANAPDMCALHEATQFLGQGLEDIRILSIGTTTARFSISHSTGPQLGAYQWFRGTRLLSTMIAAQQQLTDEMVKHVLRERYLRVDWEQSREQEADLGLDVATEAARKTIAGMADGAYQKVASNPFLQEMLRHRAPGPTFHYAPTSKDNA